MESAWLLPLLTVMTLIGLLPLLAVITTSFTNVSIVLLIVRNAIGIQQTPPNMIIFTIAILITLLVMQTTFQASLALIPTDRLQSMGIDELSGTAKSASEPFRQFMLDNSSVKSREAIVAAATRRTGSSEMAQTDYVVVISAFVIDELTRAFSIGFLLYIPFLIIDFVVGAILIALGMQMLSATAIATPLKLLLFVQVDGWKRLFDMFMLGYR